MGKRKSNEEFRTHGSSRLKAGRPTKKAPAIVDEIIQRVSEGETYASICKDEHMPSFRTLFRWEQEDPEFRQLSTRARELGTHYLAQDCIRIADDTALDAQQKRIMVDTRLRLIGKWNRKNYGDKVEVNQKTPLESASNEELKQALQQKLKALKAQGIDVEALIRSG